eukprot:NODE_1679_length_874_cov_87.820606_g1319_i0.p4 GENE.NODE_1679_length_874_cov_87.820606_g1319_i0~~NODE_1679_length_874_cov_87.820606_g1319_i0.p4  ORF type:complete len:101 (+),score=29.48 NODE_1679_length_874_cov_87.820606_g1319_i0:560-862(+)
MAAMCCHLVCMSCCGGVLWLCVVVVCCGCVLVSAYVCRRACVCVMCLVCLPSIYMAAGCAFLTPPSAHLMAIGPNVDASIICCALLQHSLYNFPQTTWSL